MWTDKRQRQKPRPRIPSDKDVKVIVNRCDICSEQVSEMSSGYDIEYGISVVNEINDSFESCSRNRIDKNRD